MAGNTFGESFRIVTFGESHGKAIGVVIDGVMPGLKISSKDIQKELDRRKPGQSRVTTQRKEEDRAEILSGIFNGKTTGTPICILVWNKDADSSKYEKLKDLFRPGHADFTFLKKYGIRDYRGGGRSSGRETIGRVAAGAIAKKILDRKGIKIRAYVKEVAGIKARKTNLNEIERNPIRCPDRAAAKKMETAILRAKKEGDSVGGIVEAIVSNVPPGLGDPVFDKIDANLAGALMSIGAVKGVEIGAGFGAARMRGSEDNDQITKKGFKTNNAGGILGGISTGQDIITRVAVKPTASISKPQKTTDKRGREKTIKIEGRHDPCICPRIVPVVEAMIALVIVDAMQKQKMIKNATKKNKKKNR